MMIMRKPSWSSSILTTKASLHQSRSAVSNNFRNLSSINRSTRTMNEKYQISKMNYHTTSTSSTTSTTRIINLNNNTRHRANNVNISNNKTQHQTSSFRLNYYFQRFDQSKTNHTITTPFVSSIMAFMMIIFTYNNYYK